MVGDDQRPAAHPRCRRAGRRTPRRPTGRRRRRRWPLPPARASARAPLRRGSGGSASAPGRPPPRGGGPRTRTRRPRPAAATAPRAWTGRRTAPRPRACRRSRRRSRSPRPGTGTPARSRRDRRPRARTGRAGRPSATGRRTSPPWRRSRSRPRPGPRRTSGGAGACAGAAAATRSSRQRDVGQLVAHHRAHRVVHLAGRREPDALVPAVRLEARHRDRRDRRGGQPDRDVDDPVLLPADDRVAGEDDDRLRLRDRLDGRHGPATLLAQLEVARRRGRGRRLVRGLPRDAPLERGDDQPVPRHRDQRPDRWQCLPDRRPHLFLVHVTPSSVDPTVSVGCVSSVVARALTNPRRDLSSRPPVGTRRCPDRTSRRRPRAASGSRAGPAGSRSCASHRAPGSSSGPRP